MALYHFSAQMISRSTGRSAVAAIAYRSGQEITDERTGIVHDYTRKGGVVHCEILAPDGAPAWVCDRAELWNAVEGAEKRKDAQLAREVEISLPRELSREDRANLVSGFVQEHFVSRGMVADIAIHEPIARDGECQPHAHVMLTTRQLSPEGFGGKAREWNDRAALEQWREGWAGHVNRALERAGHEQRVDHRSLEAQRAAALGVANDNTRPEQEQAQARERADQLDREPLPTVSLAVIEMERRGIQTARGDQLREVQARNAERASLRQQLREVGHQLAEVSRELAAMARDAVVSAVDRVTKTFVKPAPAKPVPALSAEQREAQRLERMTADELRAEIKAATPPPVAEVVQRDPAMVKLNGELAAVTGQLDRAGLAKRAVKDWREAHSARAAMYDRGISIGTDELQKLVQAQAALDLEAKAAEVRKAALESSVKRLQADLASQVELSQEAFWKHRARMDAALKLKEERERFDRMVREARAPDTDRERRTGKVMKVDEKYVWQDIGGYEAVKHDRARFGAEVPTVGERVTVQYNKGAMTVKRDLDRSLSKDRGVGR